MTTSPKVEYRRLGNSGLRVSVPIVGCMSFGSPEWQPWVLDAEASLKVLKAAWENGLTAWDTANVYSNGESEKIVGRAIREFGIPREQLVIMTKGFAPVAADIRTRLVGVPNLDQYKEYTNNRGLSRKALFSAVEKSLERLGTDYIDLYQIHRYDKDTPAEETMEALHDLVKSGKIRYIGASSMYAWQFAHLQHTASAHNWTKFISMQNHYSLLYREEEREMNPFCKFSGVGLIPWSPLARGHLARPPTSSTTRERSEKMNGITVVGTTEVDQKIIKRVQEVAEKKGWKMATVALAWVCAKVDSPIVGISSVERLEEVLEAGGKVLSKEEIEYLEEAYVVRGVSGH